MPILYAIVFGMVQGATEFLPVSSSGHALVLPDFFGWGDVLREHEVERAFAVALHLGAFTAGALYFRSDLIRYVRAARDSFRLRSVRTIDERLAWLLLLAAFPGAITGALFGGYIEAHLDGPVLIGIMMVTFGLLMWWADRQPGMRQFKDFHRDDALNMGTAQALALQPGISRSGVTMSVGRSRGFDRPTAVRLSFLMSLPVTAGAGIAELVILQLDGGLPNGFMAAFVLGVLTSALGGWLAIAFLLRFVQTRSLAPFVIYRVVVGTAFILIFATGWQ